MVEPDFIPSTPLDLVVLRDKFVEAVRRHLLAEVTLGIISFVMYLWGRGGVEGDASTKPPQPVFILSINSSLNDFIPDK
jgi:hypothetical protein